MLQHLPFKVPPHPLSPDGSGVVGNSRCMSTVWLLGRAEGTYPYLDRSRLWALGKRSHCIPQIYSGFSTTVEFAEMSRLGAWQHWTEWHCHGCSCCRAMASLPACTASMPTTSGPRKTRSVAASYHPSQLYSFIADAFNVASGHP